MEFTFRRLTRDDFGLMSLWLGRPHVLKWWEHDPSPEAVEADFGAGVDRTDPVDYFVVWLDERPIGFIQRHVMRHNPHWLAALQVVEAPPDAIGIDYFIGEVDLVGRGIGTALIGAFIEDTRADCPDASMILVDIDPANPASWRALEKNGFEHIWTGELDVEGEEPEGVIKMYQLYLHT
jgi:aminoglycoside 6'-N-acetyltransferase